MSGEDGQPKFVNPRFVERMEFELQANAHKGDWRAWQPSPLQALGELNHHVTKLIKALEDEDRAGITELSADIANAAMKIAETHGGLK